jgi:activating signal cointegrator 1
METATESTVEKHNDPNVEEDWTLLWMTNAAGICADNSAGVKDAGGMIARFFIELADTRRWWVSGNEYLIGAELHSVGFSDVDDAKRACEARDQNLIEARRASSAIGKSTQDITENITDSPTFDPPVRMLSLWQPWASLIAWGDKKIETRGWGTEYRGWVAIHATAKLMPEGRTAVDHPAIWAVMDRMDVTIEDLPLGGILCIARLVDCVRFSGETKTPEPECHFGDFRTGRYGFVLEGVRALPAYLKCAGQQGFSTIRDRDVLNSVIKFIRQQTPPFDPGQNAKDAAMPKDEESEVLFAELDNSPEHKRLVKTAKALIKIRADRKLSLEGSKEQEDKVQADLAEQLHAAKITKFKHDSVIVELIERSEKVKAKLVVEEEEDGDE